MPFPSRPTPFTRPPITPCENGSPYALMAVRCLAKTADAYKWAKWVSPFSRWLNHPISQQIVHNTLLSPKALVLENLGVFEDVQSLRASLFAFDVVMG